MKRDTAARPPEAQPSAPDFLEARPQTETDLHAHEPARFDGQGMMRKAKPPKETHQRRPKAAEEQRGVNPRKALFETFYRNGGPDFPPGNAYRSALAAGYSPITAKANCHLLAREVRVKTAEALEACGCDGFSQAEKLIELREAKTVKWNPKKNRWDTFQDGDLQLRAVQEINKILDAYPAPKETNDTRPVMIVLPKNFSNLAQKPANS
jgi:hypothetical protein